MQLHTDAFEHAGQIPKEYTCDGEGVSPTFRIAGVPEGVVSLVLIMDDPDSPKGTWTHWLVWNIPSDTEILGSTQVPPGAREGLNSAGVPGYYGPCPHEGSHRYFFRLYALDTLLELPSMTTQEELLAAMKKHIVTETELVGLYCRN